MSFRMYTKHCKVDKHSKLYTNQQKSVCVMCTFCYHLIKLHCYERHGANLLLRASFHSQWWIKTTGYLGNYWFFRITYRTDIIFDHRINICVKITQPGPTRPDKALPTQPDRARPHRGQKWVKLLTNFFFHLNLFLSYSYRIWNFKTSLLMPFFG